MASHKSETKPESNPKPESDSHFPDSGNNAKNNDGYIATNNNSNHIKLASEPKVNKEWVPRSKFRRQNFKLQKQKLNIIFNYSKISLSVAMEKVLNRGLNFCVLPLKLDLTQVLVDFKRFERTMIWHEFWYGREQSDNINRRLFKSKKTNHPKNYNIPKHLKMFLCAMKSELIDPKNRNQVECNLPSDELEALKILIQLQRDRIITIKPCDKGAGVIILDLKNMSMFVMNI